MKTKTQWLKGFVILIVLAVAQPGFSQEFLGRQDGKFFSPEDDEILLSGTFQNFASLVLDHAGSSPSDAAWEGRQYFAQANGSTASASGADPSSAEMDKIAEALANPLSYLWILFMQNDTIWYDGDIADALGEDAKVQNTFLLNPVLSLQLTENWKAIIRPVIPINSFETVGNVDISTTSPGTVTGVDFERETGLGDIVLWTALSNQYKPPLVWGFGPTIMLNTATDNQLGTGKFSAGPMGLAFKITKKWILGAVAQHWWSFAGEDDLEVNTSSGPVRVERPDVNLTDIQPVIRYRVDVKTNIGLAPNWRYNWETDQLSLPIGIGGDTLIKIGPLPVKIGLELYYYVERDDDFGPRWQIRFLFVPVIPSPNWARSPIFN